MSQLFLLKLVAELIKSDKPTAEEVRCARTIVGQMVEAAEEPIQPGRGEVIDPISDLDEAAQLARKELM